MWQTRHCSGNEEAWLTQYSKHTDPSESIVDESLRDTQHSCFWIDDAKDLAPNYSALTGDTTAEDVVVGGGYAGLWTAIKLKETHPDRRVVLD